MFSVTYKDLYEYQLSEPKMEPLIKTFLRSYEGLFDFYVKINEADIAKRLNISKDVIIKQLVYLSKTGIIDYQASNEKSHIFLPVERVNSLNLIIDQKVLDKRKTILEKKIRSVIYYAFNTKYCRSMVLLGYFGEKPKKRCGHCDYCLKMHKLDISDTEYHEISEIILNLLGEDKIPLDTLTGKIDTYKKENIVKIIRWMIDDKLLSLDKNDLISRMQ
jgi:ATP-dependent DNA helicase RecQ